MSVFVYCGLCPCLLVMFDCCVCVYVVFACCCLCGFAVVFQFICLVLLLFCVGVVCLFLLLLSRLMCFVDCLICCFARLRFIAC